MEKTNYIYISVQILKRKLKQDNPSFLYYVAELVFRLRELTPLKNECDIQKIDLRRWYPEIFNDFVACENAISFIKKININDPARIRSLNEILYEKAN